MDIGSTQTDPKDLSPLMLDDVECPPATATGPEGDDVRGPGLPEACGWVILFVFLQVFWTIVVWMEVASSQGLALEQALDLDLQSLPVNLRLLTVAAPALLGFGILIPLGWWRMSPGTARRLGLRKTSPATWVLVLSLIMPLTVVADTLFRLAEPVHLLLAEKAGWTGLQASDVHDTLRGLSEAWLPLTILMIAAVPAIGEEFLFRGLIGRGLIARYGIIAGVGITSLMFAAVHVYPPHVIAILPVGAVLHFTYLATGNFAVPVIFHFLNNSLAAVQIRRGDAAAEDVPWLIAGFFGCYVMLGLFWLSRSNSHLRQCRDNPHISNVEEMNVPRLPNLADRETAVSPVATICAILMLLLSAALFAK